jgi:arsenate reductase
MPTITIYHNGECSKCRGALEILQERGIPHEVRWYLAEPLTVVELSALLKKLNIPASDLVRTTEDLYLQHYAGKDISEDEWITILAENPILMQRPIVVHGDKAVIARPAERMFEILH